MAYTELFTEARVETSADTRAKAIAALGFDELATAEKLDRANFDSDEQYFDAVAMLSVRHNDPTYREAYTKVRREYNAQKRAEAEAVADRQHQQEIAHAIKACTLSPLEQAEVDSRARRAAQADLAAGLIPYDQFGATVERYAKAGTETAKVEKVHGADLNRQIREAMRRARGM